MIETRNKKMSVKKVIIIIILLFLILTNIGCLGGDTNKNHENSINHEYCINIDRVFSNEEENKAIQKAEELDIIMILNVARYYEGFGKNGPTNNPPKEPTEYIWPRIIDNESLNYYQNKIIELKNNNTDVRAKLNYKVICENHTASSISYNDLTKTIMINEQIYPIELSNEYPYNQTDNAISINNSFMIIDSSTPYIKIELLHSFIVKQNFEYEEYYGPKAAFGGSVEQIIVLDQNYLPKLIISIIIVAWIS